MNVTRCDTCTDDQCDCGYEDDGDAIFDPMTDVSDEESDVELGIDVEDRDYFSIKATLGPYLQSGIKDRVLAAISSDVSRVNSICYSTMLVANLVVMDICGSPTAFDEKMKSLKLLFSGGTDFFRSIYQHLTTGPHKPKKTNPNVTNAVKMFLSEEPGFKMESRGGLCQVLEFRLGQLVTGSRMHVITNISGRLKNFVRMRLTDGGVCTSPFIPGPPSTLVTSVCDQSHFSDTYSGTMQLGTIISRIAGTIVNVYEWGGESREIIKSGNKSDIYWLLSWKCKALYCIREYSGLLDHLVVCIQFIESLFPQSVTDFSDSVLASNWHSLLPLLYGMLSNFENRSSGTTVAQTKVSYSEVKRGLVDEKIMSFKLFSSKRRMATARFVLKCIQKKDFDSLKTRFTTRFRNDSLTEKMKETNIRLHKFATEFQVTTKEHYSDPRGFKTYTMLPMTHVARDSYIHYDTKALRDSMLYHKVPIGKLNSQTDKDIWRRLFSFTAEPKGVAYRPLPDVSYLDYDSDDIDLPYQRQSKRRPEYKQPTGYTVTKSKRKLQYPPEHELDDLSKKGFTSFSTDGFAVSFLCSRPLRPATNATEENTVEVLPDSGQFNTIVIDPGVNDLMTFDCQIVDMKDLKNGKLIRERPPLKLDDWEPGMDIEEPTIRENVIETGTVSSNEWKNHNKHLQTHRLREIRTSDEIRDIWNNGNRMSLKTTNVCKFTTAARYWLSHQQTLRDHETIIKARKTRFEVYNTGQKAIWKVHDKVLSKCDMTLPTIVKYGSGSLFFGGKNSKLRGSGPVPTMKMLRSFQKLDKYSKNGQSTTITFSLADEFRSSQIDPNTNSRVFNMKSETGDKIHSVLRSHNAGTIWNRDVMAVINIRHIWYHQCAGLSHPFREHSGDVGAQTDV